MPSLGYIYLTRKLKRTSDLVYMSKETKHTEYHFICWHTRQTKIYDLLFDGAYNFAHLTENVKSRSETMVAFKSERQVERNEVSEVYRIVEDARGPATVN